MDKSARVYGLVRLKVDGFAAVSGQVGFSECLGAGLQQKITENAIKLPLNFAKGNLRRRLLTG